LLSLRPLTVTCTPFRKDQQQFDCSSSRFASTCGVFLVAIKELFEASGARRLTTQPPTRDLSAAPVQLPPPAASLVYRQEVDHCCILSCPKRIGCLPLGVGGWLWVSTPESIRQTSDYPRIASPPSVCRPRIYLETPRECASVAPISIASTVRQSTTIANRGKIDTSVIIESHRGRGKIEGVLRADLDLHPSLLRQ
jgi:hypothetical protein